MNRRTAIKAFGLASLGLVSASPVKKGLRVAHITDIHLQTEGKSCEGLVECLDDVNSQDVDLVLNGGDSIGDAFDATLQDAKDQWKNWNKILKNYDLPIKHCLGNHDIRKEGKDLALAELRLERPYYSFDKGGWHFVVLDSNTIIKDTYKGQLDEAQWEWLVKDLKKSKLPKLILSHIPILAVCVFYDGDNEKSGNWEVPGRWLHIDSRKLKDLFYKNNVKLCLSGHIHLQDRVEYLGTTYICDGAVSGAWWGGSYQECPPGYGLLDLYEDGTFSHKYLTY